ncbi:MAG: DNA-processing protein DprA [Gemmatimonadota bacterium]
MSSHVLSTDTQALLLLCGSLGTRRTGSAKPLSTVEYSRLAQWLHQRGRRPGDLLSGFTPDGPPPVEQSRVSALLARGAALALEIERWTNCGLWVLGRGDEAYPRQLKSRLGKLAPPLLYGAGEPALLGGGGLAIVGSRDADDAAERFARTAAARCAEKDVAVVSGGDRGVDSMAMSAALEARGRAVGILTEGLARAATSGRYRDALRDGALVLASPYDPGARFSVSAAMGRNKVVYARSDWALVVSSAAGRGGTWAGATENLRAGWVPLFVRDEPGAPEGNRALRSGGAFLLTPEDLDGTPDLPELLRRLASGLHGIPGPDAGAGLEPSRSPAAVPPGAVEGAATDLFDVVWPHIEQLLATERSEQEVAEALSLQTGQARAWLKRATQLGRVSKLARPLRYRLAERTASQLHLLEPAPGGANGHAAERTTRRNGKGRTVGQRESNV